MYINGQLQVPKMDKVTLPPSVHSLEPERFYQSQEQSLLNQPLAWTKAGQGPWVSEGAVPAEEDRSVWPGSGGLVWLFPMKPKFPALNTPL